MENELHSQNHNSMKKSSQNLMPPHAGKFKLPILAQIYQGENNLSLVKINCLSNTNSIYPV